jgi:hypothetical protein
MDLWQREVWKGGGGWRLEERLRLSKTEAEQGGKNMIAENLLVFQYFLFEP